MCGIAGIVARGSTLDVERERRNVRAMLSAMSHRGPDDEAIVDDQQRVLLGFRRLSIVDVEGGRQPLSSEDGRILAIANGEIYNHHEIRDRLAARHTFRSLSDCEVIPHLYEEHGAGLVDHLNGMYGIALWDGNARKLVLVRDRLGVKPLYYHATPTAVVFASELKGLFAHPDVPLELDWPHALEFLHRRWIGHPNQRPQSWFRGVEYLPAGHTLTVTADGTLDDVAYWALPRDVEHGRSEQQWIDGYRELLADSVRLQLIADVEVGLFLSGGIDSVAVAQLARHHGNFHTFSIASPGTFQTGDLDASADAARLLGVHHHEALMDDAAPLTLDAWVDLLRVLEQPLCTVEQLYKLRLHRFAKATRPDLKVILLGQGSDEFNGGYGNFWLARNAPTAPRDWESFLRSVRRAQLRSLATYQNPQLLRVVEMFAEPVLSREYLASFGAQTFEEDPWLFYLDMQRLMLQRYNLWHEDRTASAASIENRVPFLDHRLVEYSARVPSEHRAALFWNKAILRRSFAGTIPDHLVNRAKVPFVTLASSLRAIQPIWDLLHRNDYEIVEAALAQGDASRIFDGDALRRVVRSQPERTDIDWLMMVISMCFMEQAMRETRPVPPTSIPAPPPLAAKDRATWTTRWSA